MKEFNKRVLEVKINGEVHKLNFPSVRLAYEYDKQSRKSKDGVDLDSVLDLIEQCGLSKEIAFDLEIDQLKELIDTLMDVKKKN